MQCAHPILSLPSPPAARVSLVQDSAQGQFSSANPLNSAVNLDLHACLLDKGKVLSARLYLVSTIGSWIHLIALT